jgi:hypothetical protein
VPHARTIQVRSVLGAKAIDHALGHPWPRLPGQVAQSLQRPPKRRKDASALRADANVHLDPVPLVISQLLIQIRGEVRVRPAVLAHESHPL